MLAIQKIRIALVLWGLVVLTGCVSTQITPQAQEYYEGHYTKLKSTSMALVADGCALRMEVGTSHVVLDASERIARILAEYLREEAKMSNLQTQQMVLPQRCGGDLDRVEQYEVAPTKGAERKPVEKLPLLASTQHVSSNAVEVQKLLNALVKASTIVDTKEGQMVQPVKLDIGPDQARQLAQVLKSDYVLISSAVGLDISAGRSFGTAFLQVAAGGAIGAAVGAMAYPVYYTVSQDATAAQYGIVDLGKQELIWKRTELMGTA